MTTPALLLDVDGPLNPFVGDDDELVANGYLFHPTHPLAIYLPAHGEMLRDFAGEHGFELVWCTYWEDQANELLSPVYGFGQLPVIHLGTPTLTEYHGSWKYKAVLEWAGERPIAWLDDEHGHHNGEERRFLQARRGPTKLVTVDPAEGLQKSHLDEIAEWKSIALP